MRTHGYKKKTGKPFLDFTDRVYQKYASNTEKIFLVLDNVSIHKSNKVKDTVARNHLRIQLVFLLSNHITQVQPNGGQVAVDAQAGNKQLYFLR